MQQATIVCGEFWPEVTEGLQEVGMLELTKNGFWEYPLAENNEEEDYIDHAQGRFVEYGNQGNSKYNVYFKMTINFIDNENTLMDNRIVDVYNMCRYDDDVDEDEIVDWEFKGKVPFECVPEGNQMEKVRLEEFIMDESNISFFSRFASLKYLEIVRTTFSIEALSYLIGANLQTLIYDGSSVIVLISPNDTNAPEKSSKILNAFGSVNTLKVKPCPSQLAEEVVSKLKLGNCTLEIDENEVILVDGTVFNPENELVYAKIMFTGEFASDVEKIMPKECKFTKLSIHLENVKYANEREIMTQVLSWLKDNKREEVEYLIVFIIKAHPRANKGLQVKLKDYLPNLKDFDLYLVKPNENPGSIENDPLGNAIKRLNVDVTFSYKKINSSM